MPFVCPLPQPWATIHKRLKRAWIENGSSGAPPPTPLILNGWVYSNDVEKQERWKATVDWAKLNGFEQRIPELTREEKYIVQELTAYAVGPMGGPMYLPWSFEPKERPDEKAVVAALQRLQQHWHEVAGDELAENTEPIKFTGKKRRRLLVKANPDYQPAWGGWSTLAHGDARRSFTSLRKAVNHVIAPLTVDHIDFVASEEWRLQGGT